jgi:LDH2 family malate/lactate/ureidoglycolate dehydrogenase
LVDRAKACPLANGFKEIMMPGEREARLAEEQRRNGMKLQPADIEMLAKESAAANVAPLWPADPMQRASF